MTLSLSLQRVTYSTLAGVALAASSVTAFAFPNTFPDPFVNQTVSLQTMAGTLATLPGVGPGGATLYADEFIIDGFSTPSVSGNVFTYTANFFAEFLDASGNPVGGFADLNGGTFVVEYSGRTGPFDLGTYDMILQTATFSGTSSIGDFMEVSLGNVPNANVTIGTGPGGFEITYNQAFEVVGQYELNNSGTVNQVPGLEDVNGQPPAPAAVAAPASLALLIPGLLGIAGLRRRQAA